MALPVSPYEPLRPYVSFQESNIPNIPVDFHPSLQSTRIYIIVSALNEVVSKSQQNQARMFTYNMICSNGFQNEMTDDLIRFINDYGNMLYLKRKTHTPIEIIDAAVQQAGAFLTSLMIYRFPELRSIVHPTVLNASQENLNAYQQVLNELQNFYQNLAPYFQRFLGQDLEKGSFMQPNGMMPGMQVGFDPRTGQWVQYPAQNPQQFQPGMQGYGFQQNQPGLNSGAIYQGQGAGHIAGAFMRPEFNAGAQGEVFSERYGKTRVNAVPIQQEPNQAPYIHPVAEVTRESMKSLTIDDWKPTANQPYLLLTNSAKSVYVFKRNDAGEVIQDITVVDTRPIEEIESEIMDRAAHEAFFNKTPKPVHTQIRDDIDHLFAIDSKKIEHSVEEHSCAEISEYFYPSWIVTSSIEEAYQNIRFEHVKKDSLVYRAFVNIAEPFFAKADLSSIMTHMQSISSIDTGARKSNFFMRFVSNFSNVVRVAQITDPDEAKYMQPAFTLENPEMDRLIAASRVAYIMRFEQYLTDLINSFIKGALSLKVEIEQFHADYEDFKRYMVAKYPAMYITEIENYENYLMNRLFTVVDEKSLDTVRESYMDDDKRVFVNFIPRTVSVTSVDTFRRHLIDNSLIADLKKSPMLIRRNEQPMLFKIATSIFKQAPAMGYIPLEHKLITADHEIFTMYKGALGSDAYLISMD